MVVLRAGWWCQGQGGGVKDRVVVLRAGSWCQGKGGGVNGWVVVLSRAGSWCHHICHLCPTVGKSF